MPFYEFKDQHYQTFHLKEFANKGEFDGVIPAYRGFHPHYVGSTQYAYIKTTFGLIASDIQEKKPFTDNRAQEYASSGTYYFKSARLMLEACNYAIDNKIQVSGEYYVSLAYKYLFEQKKKVSAYPLQHFMQWGTPQDLEEYLEWSKVFKILGSKSRTEGKSLENHHIVLPMAGLGKRFFDEGFKVTKPLIPISGKPMVAQALSTLPRGNTNTLVVRSDMPQFEDTRNFLTANINGLQIVEVPEVTQGQACTAQLGIERLKSRVNSGIVTIGVCDSGMLYNFDKLEGLVSKGTDVIVWGAKGHASAIRNPKSYGWIDCNEGGEIQSVSVKSPLTDIKNRPIITGVFTFKSIEIFEKCYKSLLERKGLINGEFYLDSMIQDALNLGFNCRFFEVDSFISWGTPQDYRTFEYWQSCFHKWSGHPYSLYNDPMIDESKVAAIDLESRKFIIN